VRPDDVPPTGNDAGLYDDAPCGLLLTRANDGVIQRANRTFCRWLGVEPADLVAKRRFPELLTMGGRIFHQTHMAPLLQMQGSVAEVKLDLQCAHGTLPIMVNAVRHGDGPEATIALAVFVAKERHAYERELMLSRRQAEALVASQLAIQEELRHADRRKDEFLAMLAHELRNPLAPIAMSSALLRVAADDPKRVRQIGEVVGRQIAHLTDLVDDLLDVSRVTRGLIELDLVPVDLADIAAAAVEQARPLIDTRGQALQLVAPRGLVVEGDRTRLVQVVVNLLNNAAKYTPQGGHIALALEAIGDEARIAVADDGIGIEAALLPHVFDLFTQAERTPDRSQGGLGIGLALVRSLVVLHRGRIEANSAGAGQGSRFEVHLPLATRAVHAPGLASLQAPDATYSLRVLVVDDNADIAAMLVDVIRQGGHAAECVASAQEALDRVARHGAPDAFVLDIGLPDISGYTLASRLRAMLPPPLPLFVALTGYGQPQDRARSLAAGFDHHLVKPAETPMIVELLDAFARGRLAAH
jgi:signal transduction histidine kinase/ActR/RegA family two-component response regulator